MSQFQNKSAQRPVHGGLNQTPLLQKFDCVMPTQKANSHPIQKQELHSEVQDIQRPQNMFAQLREFYQSLFAPQSLQ